MIDISPIEIPTIELQNGLFTVLLSMFCIFGTRYVDHRMQSIKNISLDLEEVNEEGDAETISTGNRKGELVDYSKRNPLTGSLLPSEKMKLVQLLDGWEEPERESKQVSMQPHAFQRPKPKDISLYPSASSF
jgi:hypothetical protein